MRIYTHPHRMSMRGFFVGIFVEFLGGIFLFAWIFGDCCAQHRLRGFPNDTIIRR